METLHPTELVPQTSIQCKFRSVWQKLLSVPLLPAGYTSAGTHVIAKVKLGIDSSYANTHDSDFYLVLSDGYNATGFTVQDRMNYGTLCCPMEGTSGSSLKICKYNEPGPPINANNAVPQVFDFFFSTKQKWASCVTTTAYEGSYTTVPQVITLMNYKHTMDSPWKFTQKTILEKSTPSSTLW